MSLKNQLNIGSILDSINDGFFIIDRNWRFVYVNRAFEKTCECTKEDVQGVNYWEKFPKARTLKFYPEYQRAMTERVNVHFEEYASSFDKWVSVNAYPYEDGLAVYFTDISEEHKLRQKIESDEHNLRALINNTSDLIWSVDRNLNLIFANDIFFKWAYKVFGTLLQPGDYLFLKTIGKERISRWKGYYQRAFNGESFTVSEEFHKGERAEYAEARLRPIYGSSGNIVGASCVSRDITEQKKAFLIIQEQNKQLKDIAWIQSHRVRGPVARMLGLQQLFNIANPSDPINGRVLNDIGNELLELDKIIREIDAKANFQT